MKKLFFLLACLFPLFALGQQTAVYSQYMFNGLLLNPAYAGYKEDINISLLNRSQWVGVSGAPNTQSLIADGAFFNNKNVGLGLAIVNDRVGIQGQTSAMFNYSYRLQVGDESRLSFGIAAGGIQFSLNSNKAIIDDPTDPNFSGMQSYLAPDARAGVYFSNDNFYAGLSATNLLVNAVSKNNLRSQYVILPNTHFFLTAGAIFDVNNSLKFKPSFLLREDPKSMGNFDINASFLINDRIWLGGSYRMGVDMWKNTNSQFGTFQQNSLVGLVEVYVAKQFRFGYAYDYSLSRLNTLANGSHEFSIGFIFGGNDERNNILTTPRYF